MRECPPVSKALLEYLEESFPDKIPRSFISLDELRHIQGGLEVVARLRWAYEQQNPKQFGTT